jgi:hypothetical protein
VDECKPLVVGAAACAWGALGFAGELVPIKVGPHTTRRPLCHLNYQLQPLQRVCQFVGRTRRPLVTSTPSFSRYSVCVSLRAAHDVPLSPQLPATAVTACVCVSLWAAHDVPLSTQPPATAWACGPAHDSPLSTSRKPSQPCVCQYGPEAASTCQLNLSSHSRVCEFVFVCLSIQRQT